MVLKNLNERRLIDGEKELISQSFFQPQVERRLILKVNTYFLVNCVNFIQNNLISLRLK